MGCGGCEKDQQCSKPGHTRYFYPPFNRMEVKLAEDPIVHECYNVQQGSPNDIALLKVCSSRTRCYLFNFITPALACWRCWPHRLHPCLPSWTGRWLHRPDGKCLWWVWKAGVEPSFLDKLDSGGLWMHVAGECVDWWNLKITNHNLSIPRLG